MGESEPSRAQVPSHRADCQISASVSHHDSQVLPAANRAYGSMHVCGQACPTETQAHAGVPCTVLLSVLRPPGSCGDNPRTGSRIPALMAGLCRGPLRQAPTFSDVSNRCVRSGLGCTLRGSEDTRLVVEGRDTSYQPEGAQGSLSGLPNLSHHFAKSQHDRPDR